jgi:phage FluMu gp28-like protein
MAATLTIPGSRARHSIRARERLLSALPPADASAVSIWLDVAFFPFQREWVLDFSPYSIVNKSRQIGCSHSKAGWCALCAMLGETTTVVSRREKDVLEVMEAAERHLTMLRDLGASWARPLDRGGKYTSNGQLRLITGGRLIQDVAESGGRGFSGNVMLDEFGYHGDGDEALYEAAAGATTLGGKIHIVSTPNGVGNLFHSIFTDEKKWPSFIRHETTIWDAIREGFPIDPDDLLAKLGGDRRLFGQVYEGKFLDGAEQYIPSELIEAAAREPIYTSPEQPAYGGLDIGRVADLTCLVIVRVDANGIARVVNVEVLKRTATADLDRLAYDACVTWGVRRLCIDATGMGSFPADDIKKRYGTARVECVDFTLASKEDLATTLHGRLHARTLKLPPADADLQKDLSALRRLVTSAGNIRYDAPQTRDGHADRAWALALALHGCSRPPNYRTEIES